MTLEIKADLSEARAILKVLRQVPKDLRRDVSAALKTEAQAIARDARTLLSPGPKGEGLRLATGGSPPRSRTGRLKRSIRAKRGRGGLTYLVESRDHPTRGPIALWLERGTEHGGRRVTRRTRQVITRGGIARLSIARRSVREGGRQRMPPHPFITAALERRAAHTEKTIAKAVAGVLAEAEKTTSPGGFDR